MALSSIWKRAESMAQQTPEERNRYVDLLRALSIGFVVLGHWIIAAPFMQNGSAQMSHVLSIQPWSQWLTWLFQVMPIFFFVGGFSNGVSWDGALNKNLGYGTWLETRLRRLLGPVIPLVAVWLLLGIIGNQLGVHPEMIRVGSQISLVPVWFLAIYFVIVMLVPLTRLAWHRYGYWSVIIPVALAVLGDWVYFNTPYKWFGWFNYLFIWSAMHQLGYAWQAGRLGDATKMFSMAIVALVGLVLLTHIGPYSLSLVGVPGEAISNTTPPKLPLMALGLAQIGLLISIEKPMRNWLSNAKVWTSTVLVNGLIMPIFLWHSTVMILMIGAAFWLAPNLLEAFPGTTGWWAARPIWLLSYFTVLLIALPLFLFFEGFSNKLSGSDNIVLVIICAGLICLGLAMLANGGVAGTGLMNINWLACLLPIVAATILVLFKHKAVG